MIDHRHYLSTAAQGFTESAIRRSGARGARVPGLISFAPGFPADAMFPWDEINAISGEILASRAPGALQYGSSRGFGPLIEQAIGEVAGRGVHATPDDVVVTAGSQQGIDLACRVLADPGDAVLVERPTFSGALAAFHNLRTRVVGVPLDAAGVSIDALDAAVAAERAAGRRVRFIYVTPNFQNPTGVLTTARRRAELLEAASRHDFLIVEDDPYGTLYFEDRATAADTRPLKADDEDGRVVYLSSLSKTLAPGLRVAWLVAPAAIADRIELAKQAADLCGSMLDQRIVNEVLARGIAQALLPTLRQMYRRKAGAMEDALRATLGDRVTWTAPRGGFFIWLRLPAGLDDEALFERALQARVSFVAGRSFYPDESEHGFARLSFSAPAVEAMAEGVSRLAGAIGTAASHDQSGGTPLLAADTDAG